MNDTNTETKGQFGEPKPLEVNDLIDIAVTGSPFPIDRVLATYADQRNWAQIYNGEGPSYYHPKPCEWAFIGPVRPGYELAQHALERSGHDLAAVSIVPTAVIEEVKALLCRANSATPVNTVAETFVIAALEKLNALKP